MDDNGNAIREAVKDSEVLAQYKIMREILIYLSNLDPLNTEALMQLHLNSQVLKLYLKLTLHS